MSLAESKRLSARFAFSAVIALIAIAGFAALYWHTASLQSPQNHNRDLHDQGAYIGFAKAARESGFRFSGNRNRMPLYPYLQSLFYSPDMDDESYFQQGKLRNVALSMLCLLALGIAFFHKFSRIYAIYALLFIAFIVFAIKAPYFQAEILFYTLFGFAFIACLEAISAPRWHKPLVVGALFALAHLTKASAMPALFIFAGSYLLPLLGSLFQRNLNRASLRNLMYAALAPVAVFMLLLSPYFAESAANYRMPFYNVNTTFYMWFDSWDEAKAWSNQVKDRQGYPDVPADEIPSLEKYLREHSPRQVVDRFTGGISTIVESACYCKWCRYKTGYCSQAGLSLLLLALSLPIAIRPWRRKDGDAAGSITLANAQMAAFTLVFFLTYTLSFAWYMPLIGKGPRTFLSLAIPLLWTLGLLAHSPGIQSLRIRLRGRDISVFKLASALMLLGLAYEIFEVVTIDAAIMDGGN